MNKGLTYRNNSNINFCAFQDVSRRKKQHQDTTKEGVVVNTFIKDNNDSCPQQGYLSNNTQLPADMFQKKENISGKWFNNPIVPLIAAPIAILGIGAGLSLIYKKSMFHKYNLEEKARLPLQGRVITINNDTSMALLMLVQDPSHRNFQVTAAVIAASATAFIMKNVVDGFKEIWVKKKAADIKRDKEEKLIDIETRSFAGKNQIIRNLIEQKTSEIKDYIGALKDSDPIESFSSSTFARFKNKVSFKNSDKNNDLKENKKDDLKNQNKAVLYGILGIAAFAAAAVFSKSIFKNIRTVTNKVEEKSAEIGKGLKEELVSIKTAKDLETRLSESKISDLSKDLVREKWSEIHDPSKFAAPPATMTNYKNKTGFASFVLADASSFIYTWLINPNPQTKMLAMLMCGAGALGYSGQTLVKGVKEVQVEKANANTEVELQDRLVQVELKNFYQKKKSYIEPFMENHKKALKHKPSSEEVKKIQEDIFCEIKNGPPFVYS